MTTSTTTFNFEANYNPDVALKMITDTGITASEFAALAHITYVQGYRLFKRQSTLTPQLAELAMIKLGIHPTIKIK